MKKIIAACLLVVVIILILNIGSISRLGVPYAANGAAAIDYNAPYTAPYNSGPVYTVAQPAYVPVTPVTYAYPPNYSATASNYNYANLPSRATNYRYSGSGATTGYSYNSTSNTYIPAGTNTSSTTVYSTDPYNPYAPYNPPYNSSNTYYTYQ